VKKKKKKAFIS